MKKTMSFFCRITLMILAFVTGASSGVMMAEASNLPDAGKTTAGADGTGGTDGISTETGGRETGDPNFYLSDVDKRIVKIRPMATPIDQISRYAKSSSTNSFEVKYYSVGTREIKCSTNKKLEAMLSGASVSLPVDDLNMFTLDDTIRVVGVSAITKPDGTKYTEDDSNVPDLVLCVCGKDSSTNLPTVYAVNGKMDDSSKQPILVPEIPQGTTLVRMGKACGELDVPICKGSSGVLIMNDKEAARAEAQPCIRCAKCVSVCPMGLEPFLLATLSAHKDWERVEKEDVMSCIECGSCQFTCPSHRYLLDYIRLGKGTVGGIIRARNAKK